MEYHLDLPVDKITIKKLQIGDILYVSGIIFTARDEAHHKMLGLDKTSLSGLRTGGQPGLTKIIL